MKNLGVILLILSALLQFGCNKGKIKQNLLPGISGAAGEVVIVMDKKYWDNEPGKAFTGLLREDVPGLPQSEPLFNPINIPLQSFSDLFKTHRNIIITQISNNIEMPGISVENNKWADPQLTITLVAQNSEQFMALFEANNQKILGLLFKAEKDRITQNYMKYPELDVMSKVEKNANIKLTIPKGYAYALDTTNFIWLSHETPDKSQGIFIYYYAYNDSSAFTANALINKRNEVLKQFVSGPLTGTFMTTELQVFPQYRSYNIKQIYTAELRGLWRVEGDFMGGPFVSISQYDAVNSRIVTVEGFVYAPKYNKREYMRQVEAIVFSLVLPEKETKANQ